MSPRAFIGGVDAGVAALGFEAEDAARMAYLNAATRPRRCRVCGSRIPMDDESTATVCTACGGRKREKQLEAEELARAAQLRRREALLSMAGITPTKERAMSDAQEKVCSTPGCGRRLRSNNKRGTCPRCEFGHPAEAPVGQGSPRKVNLRKRFKVVAEALGENPDELINAFCEGWLEQVKAAVERTGE